MAGSRLARNEWRKRATRSLLSTAPAEVPPSRRAWLSDRPGWCVDLGASLVAMTTCDLWLALARGDVAPAMKVWREGMPYWDAVSTVPEFALALPDAAVWAPESQPPASAVARAAATAALATAAERDRTTLPTPIPAAAPMWVTSGRSSASGRSSMSESHARPARDAFSEADEMTAADERSAFSAVNEMSLASAVAEPATLSDGATLPPASDFSTPAPMVVEPHTASPPPSGTRRRLLGKLDRGTLMSVAFGAAVAVITLAVATGDATPDPFATSGAPDSAHAGAMAAPAHGADFTELIATPIATDSLPPDLAASANPSDSAIPSDSAGPPERQPRGPHAADRGQRRARVGSPEERMTSRTR